MKKALIAATVLIIIVVILGLLSCGKKADEPKIQGQITQEAAEAAAELESQNEASTGKMNDDIYVELLAHSIVMTKRYGEGVKAAKTLAEVEKVEKDLKAELKKVFEKHGVTENEYSAYAKKLEKEDPVRFAKLFGMASRRAEELYSK